MSTVLDCPTKGAMRFPCAQAGCKVCLDVLLREHSGLVYWMVMHQAGRKTAYADLLQAGRIGLWSAILHYEVGRGTAFSSYACVVIRHQVWQLLRQEHKAEGWLEADGGEDSLERVIRVYSGNRSIRHWGMKWKCYQTACDRCSNYIMDYQEPHLRIWPRSGEPTFSKPQDRRIPRRCGRRF